jgi:NAD(P)-dependent dehydrogenase (short-subunit alcohol dehydrogenase family)
MAPFDFTGKVVLITGATGALGRVVARQFHTAGATLALTSRSEPRLHQLFPDLALDPQHLLLGGVDLREMAPAEAMVQQIAQRFGRLDVVVNTVGGYRGGVPVHQMTVDDWDDMLTLNARVAFIVSRAVVPLMQQAGEGKIVHVAGRAALLGSAGVAAYAAAKSAVVRLTESLAAELREHGINVNCVLPGTIDTPANRAAMPNADFSRWVAPEAVGEVILFLCSPAARALYGAAIPVG